MAELTIQIPDDLAQRLAPIQARLPELLSLLADSISANQPQAVPLPSLMTSETLPAAYAEVIDFLIARPAPQEIANFKVSEAAQARLCELLEQNREAALTETQRAELDLYEQLDSLMMFLKARATAVSQSINGLLLHLP